MFTRPAVFSLRSTIEHRVARLRALGWRGLLEIEQDTLRRLLKTTIAATLAWEAASEINSQQPVLAALGAILVVQVTVRASLSRSIELTIAVTLGLVAALALGTVLGQHWWSIALIVLAGLIAGELLRLGPFSSQAATSALLAVSLGSAYGYIRMVDTLIGAVIGVLVNALIVPPSYVSEASGELRRIGEDLAALLTDIGAGLRSSFDRPAVERWLDRARASSADARVAENTVARGEESLRFNPLAHRDLATLQRLDEARLAMEHALSQTRGIARALLEMTSQPTSDDEQRALRELGPVLRLAGAQVAAFGRLQEYPDAEVDRQAARTAHAGALLAREPLLAALAEIGAADDRGARQVGAILVDADRLLNEMDIEAGAHKAAVSVEEPDPE